MTNQEFLDYYVNSLIIQYRNKTKAKKTIQCLVNNSLCDGLPVQMASAFNLDTATGDPLTIIGKIVGVPRNIYGLDLTHEFFNFTRFTSEPASNGFNRFASPTGSYLFARWRTNATYVTTDFELRAMIRLKIMYNNYYSSLKIIKEALYSNFSGGIDILDESIGGGINGNTAVMLHGNGTNGSTTFTEETGKTATRHGDAQISTAQSVFGGASMLFDGTGDYLTIPDDGDFQLGGGTGTFTIESRIRLTSVGASPQTIVAQYVDANNYWELYFNNAGFGFVVKSGGSTVILDTSITWSPSTDTWYHIALVRNGSTFTIYVDGTEAGNFTSSASIPDLSGSLYIGDKGDGTRYFSGYMDEFRIQNSAEWTDDFTPPTEEYSPASNEVTYNFEEIYHNVGTICEYLGNILPKPMGVALNVVNV